MNRRQVAHLTPGDRLALRSTAAANGCIEWYGGRTTGGYGQLRVKGRHFLAHRLAWEIHNGPIPDGLVVCHSCDNPPCVNLDHLSLGTPTANTQDAIAKGRMSWQATA